MGLREDILEYLSHRPDGADDDRIADALGLSQRQSANSYCRRMEDTGLIVRRRIDGKIRNFLAPDAPTPRTVDTDGGSAERSWHWEGNVQDVVVRYLIGAGYTITKYCNTLTKEPGKDIEAELAGRVLWVTVKGYPNGTERTHATTQAGHWFKQAIFDIIAWRGESSDADLALALPDFPRYRKLAQRIGWLLSAARYSILWVDEDGSVTAECEPSAN